MLRPTVRILFFLLIGCVLAHPARAANMTNRETVTTEGEGEAEIQGEDFPLARGEALEDALQKAFENALVEILPLDLSLTGRQDLMDQLGPRLKRYLLQYRILSEMPALQVFFLNVEATFSVPLIQDDLVALGVSWSDEGVVEPVELFVRVDGVGSVRAYQELMQWFRQSANVKAVTPYEAFGTAMVLRLEYAGGVDDLLEAISGWISEEFAFRVEQVSEGAISVSLVRPGGQGMER